MKDERRISAGRSLVSAFGGAILTPCVQGESEMSGDGDEEPSFDPRSWARPTAEPATQPSAEPASQTAQTPDAGRRKLLVGGGVILVAAAAGGTWLALRPRGAGP